jgi:hypothetical protein
MSAEVVARLDELRTEWLRGAIDLPDLASHFTSIAGEAAFPGRDPYRTFTALANRIELIEYTLPEAQHREAIAAVIADTIALLRGTGPPLAPPAAYR